MTLYELFAIQRDTNKLKSLLMELAEHENFNPYKSNVISDMPKRCGSGKDFNQWYLEEKERIERDIEFCKEKIQQDRKAIDRCIENAPFPECDIIRYRVINDLGWCEIGDLLGMDRRTASRKFFRYIKKLPTMPAKK